MKHRLERVNEVLKRELGDLIRREFHFEAQLVTVQQVDVTADLKQAHVFIGVIGTPGQRRDALSQLHDKRTILQQELAKRVVLKYTPLLHFKRDEAIERGTRVLNILDELNLPPESKEEEAPKAAPEKAPDSEQEHP
ncbi:MAG: 30S ribosome-binding factor RbfA [Verrucomicrobiaceae bacterium]|nr:MAG: 30S ribosome-binding factor RbfA [Verrucomicrobiaceae bacterium]